MDANNNGKEHLINNINNLKQNRKVEMSKNIN